MTARVLSPWLTSLRYRATGDAVFLRFSWFAMKGEREEARGAEASVAAAPNCASYHEARMHETHVIFPVTM